MNNTYQIIFVAAMFALGACSSGQAYDEEFKAFCVPAMQKAEDIDTATANEFCGCTAKIFKENVTPKEFEIINAAFKEFESGSPFEADLKAKLGQERYNTIGDLVEICEP